jgi:WD40 repeat protein
MAAFSSGTHSQIQAKADEIAASSDGKLFITNDCDGSISVWSFGYMSKIYQLTSTDLLYGLTLSPDGTRFYDIRGNTVNSWEPNSLIRFYGTEESSGSSNESNSDEQTSNSINQTSETQLTPFQSISALASHGRFYCAGNEEGLVHIHDTVTKKKSQLCEFFNFQEVSHIVWSKDGQTIACVDLSGDFAIRKLSTKPPSSEFQIETMPPPKFKLDERGIHQILLDPSGNTLLVIGSDFAQAWSFTESKVVASTDFQGSSKRKFTQHPSQEALFLGFGTIDVDVYQWSDLEKLSTYTYQQERPRSGSQKSPVPQRELSMGMSLLSLEGETTSEIEHIMLAQDGKHFLAQIEDTSAQGMSTKRLLIFNLHQFEDMPTSKEFEDEGFVTYRFIPKSVLSSVELGLGVLFGSRLVFLDTDLWVCTFNMDFDALNKDLTRHFFIPRDWTTSERLELTCMLADGTFLCPKDTNVAVIEYGWGHDRL